MIDLIVVGGGPVGLAASLYARRAGLDVLVIEPRSDVIDKACGEGLMPQALARLADLGIDPPGVPFQGIRYADSSRTAEARFTSGPGRGVRRIELHAAMHQRACDAGVRFVTDRVATVARTSGAVEAAGVVAGYLIAADGLHSTVRSSVGLSVPTHGWQRYGLRRHFRVEPWTDLVEVHWLPHAEVYVTPVASNMVGVAVLGGRPLRLTEALASVPAIASRLADAEPASTERGAGPLRQATSARTAGRVLLVGDAAGYVDALTGEGLRIGFAEAEAAVSAVLRDDPASYEDEWTRITRSYRLLTNALLWAAARPRARALIVPAASAMPAVFRRLVDSLAS